MKITKVETPLDMKSSIGYNKQTFMAQKTQRKGEK